MKLQWNLKGPELFLDGGGGGGQNNYVREAHITSARREVPCGRGPGPAQGPWKLWGYRCSLMQSQPYFGPFTIVLKPFFITFTAIFYAIYLYNNNFVILDPCVLKSSCSHSSYTGFL